MVERVIEGVGDGRGEVLSGYFGAGGGDGFGQRLIGDAVGVAQPAVSAAIEGVDRFGVPVE